MGRHRRRGPGRGRGKGRLTDISHAVEKAVRKARPVRHRRGLRRARHRHRDAPGPARAQPRPARARARGWCPGMALAIEPMITMGVPAYGRAGRRLDRGHPGRSIAAHVEHSMALLTDGVWVLTAVDGGRARLGDLVTARQPAAATTLSTLPASAPAARRSCCRHVRRLARGDSVMIARSGVGADWRDGGMLAGMDGRRRDASRRRGPERRWPSGSGRPRRGPAGPARVRRAVAARPTRREHVRRPDGVCSTDLPPVPPEQRRRRRRSAGAGG